MKALSLLFVVSLLANGALIVGLLQSPQAMKHVSTVVSDQPRQESVSGSARPTSSSDATQVSSGHKSIAAHSTHVPPLWSLLQNDDLGEFKRKLEAAGFPPREIRALIQAAIYAREKTQRDALVGKPDETPYWRNSSFISDPTLQSKFFAISRESASLFRLYLGGSDALADDDDALANAQRRYGNLSIDKLQQLRVLDWNLDEKRAALSQESLTTGDHSREAGKARLAAWIALDEERRSAASRVLTPDELEQFELRDSNIAAGLRSLENFQPTEAEFKALYEVERNRRQTSQIPDFLENRAEEQKQGLAQARTVLTPERFADLQAAMNPGNDKLGKLVARLELPPSTITTVNTVRDDIMNRAKSIYNDESIPVAQRNAQFATLAAEADQKLTATLGQRGYAAYVDLKGEWIRSLKKPPAARGP